YRDYRIRWIGWEFREQSHVLFESKSFGGKGERGQLCGGGWQLPVGKEKKDGFKCGFRDARAQRAAPLQLPQGGVALAGGFVEDDRSGSSGVEGLNAAGHRNVDADVGGALDFFGEAGAFVANKKSDGLAPVDFPGGEKRGVGSRWLVRLGMVKTRRNAAHGGKSSGLVVHARGEGVDASHFALRQKNGERHSGEDGEMEGRTGRGAERLRRIGAGGAADAGGGSGTASHAESGGRRRSEEHTSELQSRFDLVCRLLLEKKKCRFSSVGSRRRSPWRSPDSSWRKFAWARASDPSRARSPAASPSAPPSPPRGCRPLPACS